MRNRRRASVARRASRRIFPRSARHGQPRTGEPASHAQRTFATGDLAPAHPKGWPGAKCLGVGATPPSGGSPHRASADSLPFERLACQRPFPRPDSGRLWAPARPRSCPETRHARRSARRSRPGDARHDPRGPPRLRGQELPDASCSSSTRDDEFPEDVVREMCGDELGHPAALHPRGVRRHGRRRLRRLPGLRGDGARSTSASPPASSPPSSAATRSSFGGTEEQKTALAGAHRRGGAARRLRRHRAGGRQRPRRAADHGRRRSIEDGKVVGYQHQRQQAVDQQRRRRRPLHHPAPTPRAARPGSSSRRAPPGFTPRQARGQARHPRLATPRRSPSRTSTSPAEHLVGGVEGQGLAPGAAGLRLHPPDGRRLRPRRRLGGARPRHPLLAASASRAARRSPRSRATPTS